MLILLLLLALPVLEIYVLVQSGVRFGVSHTLFALLGIGVLGAGLARSQGRYILTRLQTTVARGQTPTSDLLQGLLVFLGGVLFLVPGFITDLVAIFFVLPGTRHLIAEAMRRRLVKKMRSGATSGGFSVFVGGPFGSGDFRPAGGGSSRPSESNAGDEFARDVSPKVIDVTPISSRTRPKSESEPQD